MYDYINGTLAELTPAYAVVEAGGVGYFLNISLQTYTALQGASGAKLFVHFTVREDAQTLYGFFSRSERDLFRLLIGVSGVGGGTARMILSTYSPAELSNIIASENALLLKNVKGLGLKTAQKIIVDLRDKVLGAGAADAAVSSPASEAVDEALAALSMLGFTRAASEKVLKTVSRENPTATVEELVRLSLKHL